MDANPPSHQPSKDQNQTPRDMPPWKVPPPTDVPPPLLAAVYGDGWRQRSTLAFGAKSLVGNLSLFLSFLTFAGPPALVNNALAPVMMTKSLCSYSNSVLEKHARHFKCP